MRFSREGTDAGRATSGIGASSCVSPSTSPIVQTSASSTARSPCVIETRKASAARVERRTSTRRSNGSKRATERNCALNVAGRAKRDSAPARSGSAAQRGGLDDLGRRPLGRRARVEPAEPQAAAWVTGRRQPVLVARVVVRDDELPRAVGFVLHLRAVDRDALVVVVVRVQELVPEAQVPERALG